MKPREAELSLSFLTWAKAKPGKPGPPILHAAQEFWSGWHFVQVSNDSVLRFRLFPRVQSSVGVQQDGRRVQFC